MASLEIMSIHSIQETLKLIWLDASGFIIACNVFFAPYCAIALSIPSQCYMANAVCISPTQSYIAN